MYSYGVNESQKIDLEAAKGHKASFYSSIYSYIDGNNLLSLTTNDRYLFQAHSHGQVNFKKTTSETEYCSIYGVKDMGLDNNRIICITSLSDQQ